MGLHLYCLPYPTIAEVHVSPPETPRMDDTGPANGSACPGGKHSDHPSLTPSHSSQHLLSIPTSLSPPSLSLHLQSSPLHQVLQRYNEPLQSQSGEKKTSPYLRQCVSDSPNPKISAVSSCSTELCSPPSLHPSRTHSSNQAVSVAHTASEQKEIVLAVCGWSVAAILPLCIRIYRHL